MDTHPMIWLVLVPIYFVIGLATWQLVDRYWSRHPDTRTVLERTDLLAGLERAVDAINQERERHP